MTGANHDGQISVPWYDQQNKHQLGATTCWLEHSYMNTGKPRSHHLSSMVHNLCTTEGLDETGSLPRQMAETNGQIPPHHPQPTGSGPGQVETQLFAGSCTWVGGSRPSRWHGWATDGQFTPVCPRWLTRAVQFMRPRWLQRPLVQQAMLCVEGTQHLTGNLTQPRSHGC
jgi:hypothetical protein